MFWDFTKGDTVAKKKAGTHWDDEAQSARWAEICQQARKVGAPDEMTLTEFENETGIGRMSQTRYEAGGHPRSTLQMRKYAKVVLGISLSELEAMLDGKGFAPSGESMEEWAETLTDLQFKQLCETQDSDRLAAWVSAITQILTSRITEK